MISTTCSLAITYRWRTDHGLRLVLTIRFAFLTFAIILIATTAWVKGSFTRPCLNYCGDGLAGDSSVMGVGLFGWVLLMMLIDGGGGK